MRALGEFPLRLTLLDWSSLFINLYWAYDHAVEPAFRDYRVAAQPWLGGNVAVWVIRAGSVTITEHDRTVVAGPGAGVVVARASHRHQFSDDARILSINAALEWPGSEPLYAIPTTVVLAPRTVPRLERTGAALTRALARVPTLSPGAARNGLWDLSGALDDFLHMQRLLLAWVEALTGALDVSGLAPTRSDRIDPRVSRAAMAIDRLPLERPFDEHGLAAEVGLSATHLERLFTGRYGLTPRRYLDGRRLRVAQQILQSSSSPVKEIAVRLGFKTLAHFSAWFRRATGLSPRAYRRQTAGRTASPAARPKRHPGRSPRPRRARCRTGRANC